MHTKIENRCYTHSLFGALLTLVVIKIEKPKHMNQITNKGKSITYKLYTDIK